MTSMIAKTIFVACLTFSELIFYANIENHLK